MPAAFRIKSEFDAVALISLSVMFTFESKVKFDITTEPVPPGSNLRSAFESVEITLSKILMLSIPTVPVIVVVPVTVKDDKVDKPSTVSVPVVDKFSFPKEIEPPESVIDPFAKVILPTVDPVAAAKVPVVVKFSLPKLMAPDESVIDPSAKVKVPNEDPVAAVIAVEKATPPVTVKEPSSIKFSFMLIELESFAIILVPALNPTAPITVFPPPLGINLMSSFDLLALILLSSIIIPSPKSTLPVPPGFRTMSAFDAADLIVLSIVSMSDKTEGRAYNSSKLLLILADATRKLSPVPSFSTPPTKIKSCAILTNI